MASKHEHLIPSNGPRLLRTKDAAAYLGMSEWKLRQLVICRELPVVRHGEGVLLFDRRDLDAFIEEHKRTG
jgi:excisionase family DNA binding protein